MKKRKYYRLAEKEFPELKTDRKFLALMAECLRKNEGMIPSKEEMEF